MFVLEADPEVAPRATLLLPEGVHSLALLRGHGLDDDDRAALTRGLAVYCDDEELALPDWFWAGVAPVVSGRLLAALVSLGVDNLEAFPVVVEHDLGPVAADYYALNVVGCVACIDLDRSEYTRFGGRLFALETMHVDPRPQRRDALSPGRVDDGGARPRRARRRPGRDAHDGPAHDPRRSLAQHGFLRSHRSRSPG